jgi:hypothetical protein
MNLWHIHYAMVMHHQVLIPVSRGYPCVKGRLPTRYSPVRRFPPAESTEVSSAGFSLDLHVLGTPPAFILSQDQTLCFDLSNCDLSRSVFLFDLYELFHAFAPFANSFRIIVWFV